MNIATVFSFFVSCTNVTKVKHATLLFYSSHQQCDSETTNRIYVTIYIPIILILFCMIFIQLIVLSSKMDRTIFCIFMDTKVMISCTT